MGLRSWPPSSRKNGSFSALRVHHAGLTYCQLDKVHIGIALSVYAYIRISVVHIQPHFMQSARDAQRGKHLGVIIIVLRLSSRSITLIAVSSLSLSISHLSMCEITRRDGRVTFIHTEISRFFPNFFPFLTFLHLLDFLCSPFQFYLKLGAAY